MRNRNTLGDFSRANSGQDSAWKSAREEKEKEDEKWSGHCLVIVLIHCFVRAMGMEMRKGGEEAVIFLLVAGCCEKFIQSKNGPKNKKLVKISSFQLQIIKNLWTIDTCGTIAVRRICDH